MGRRRYDDLRIEIELGKSMERFLREQSVPEGQINLWKKKRVREIRDKIAKIDREFRDPLEKPLTDGWRTVYSNEYGEGGYDFRILQVGNPADWTDEEIEEYIMCEVGYPPICSPYDCTGKRFTSWVSWSRQPVGIVMIHNWGLDV